MNAQKGPGSDAKLANALRSVQGEGLTNNTAGFQHMMKIGATAELAKRRAFQTLNSNRALEKKENMTPDEYAARVGGANADSPFANMSDADLQQYAAYGTPAAGAPVTPGVTPGVGQTGVLPSGTTYQVVPQ